MLGHTRGSMCSAHPKQKRNWHATVLGLGKTIGACRTIQSAGTRAIPLSAGHPPVFSPISMLAPSMVPMMKAPLSANFMLEVPLASVPAVEMCWLHRQGRARQGWAGRNRHAGRV